MLRLALIASLFVQVDHVAPERGVAGILEVPELFGDFPCDRYTPESLEVHATPSADGPILGTVEVLRQWYADEASPCESLEVGFRSRDTSRVEEIRFMEFGYEEPGLIVLEENGVWFRVSLGNGEGWVHPQAPELFHAYRQLVREALAYLRPGWVGSMRDAPATGASVRVPRGWEPYLDDDLTVEVLEDRVIAGQLWFRLRLDAAYGCGELSETPPAVEGWVPGHTSSGENTIWFYSRGC